MDPSLNLSAVELWTNSHWSRQESLEGCENIGLKKEEEEEREREKDHANYFLPRLLLFQNHTLWRMGK